jgi:hypothetical protein
VPDPVTDVHHSTGEGALFGQFELKAQVFGQESSPSADDDREEPLVQLIDQASA